MANPKITTVGAAVQDVFLMGAALRAVEDEETKQMVEQFPLGAKIDLDNIAFTTGGGATNAAVTFARAGLDVSYLGQVANDPAGEAVFKDLDMEGVNRDLVVMSDEYATGYSALLLAPSGERTILTYRGASDNYDVAKLPVHKIEADWIYVSSLAGHLDVLRTVLEHASKIGAKVALNPGKKELKQKNELLELLEHVDVFNVNKEEAQMLVEGEDPKDLVKALNQYAEFVIITDGPGGSYASDSSQFYAAGMYEDVPVKDRTGAGDAFCSGVVCKLAQGNSMQDALTYGSANSTAVVAAIGAKANILGANAEVHEMPIEATPL